jgi:glucose/arabinose dehydrogenase
MIQGAPRDGIRGRIRAGTAIVAILLGLASCSPTTASNPPGTQATPDTAVPPTGTPTPAQTPPPGSIGPADAALEVGASGLTTPVALVAPPDNSGRLFIVEQTGRILILRDGKVEPEPFLDLSTKLVKLDPTYDERGLLGLAFDPAFASNGRFFVYYGAPLRAGADASLDHTDTLSEFHVSPSDPDRADPASERFVLRFEQPQPNHSGGGLGFGPDGHLYLGTGDGGGQGDASPGHSPGGNAQDLGKLNGKILRLDVSPGASAGRGYGIPNDNPFADGRGARPEIYAYGFRNPWRLSWEPDGARRLLVSDVGYGRYEEIDVVDTGGNYGWRVREGAHCLNVEFPLVELDTCDLVDGRGQRLTDPVLEYTHAAVGIAVVGGYVYRGAAIPALRGQYVFADYSRDFTGAVEGHGTLLVAQPQAAAGAPWPWRRVILRDGPIDRFVTGMGEDAAGELYVLSRTEFGPVGETGEVLKLVPAG